MNTAKLDDIREAHQRLRDDYRLSLDRAREAQVTVTQMEASESNDLGIDEPSPKLIAARARLDRVRGEAQVLAQRLRGSQVVLDRLEAYVRVGT